MFGATDDWLMVIMFLLLFAVMALAVVVSAAHNEIAQKNTDIERLSKWMADRIKSNGE